MIQYVTGDIFSSDCEALVNPVNTKGVMGAGLASAFKNRWPRMFKEYKLRCAFDGLRVGEVWAARVGENPSWILNVATKDHWRDASRLEWIDTGTKALSKTISTLDIKSVALPALGCGLGCLNFEEVKKVIEQNLQLPDVKILVYRPLA